MPGLRVPPVSHRYAPNLRYGGSDRPAIAWAAAIQVAEALKILLGREADLHGSLLACDLWKNHFQQVKPVREPHCRTCVQHEFTYLEMEARTHISLCGRNSVQIHQTQSRGLDMTALKTRLEQFGVVRANDFLLQFTIDAYQLTIFPDGRAIIKGTEDPAVARSIYARYIGS